MASRASCAAHDPLLGMILVASGLASIALTLKWWFVERQLQIAAGSLMHLASHAEAASDPLLAWSSVITQWGSCAIFLIITAVWGLRSGPQDKVS